MSNVFIFQYGPPLLAAITQGLFALLPPIREWRLSGIRISSILVPVTIGACIYSGLSLKSWEPKSEWDKWGDAIREKVELCMQNNDNDKPVVGDDKQRSCVRDSLKENVGRIPKIDNENSSEFFYRGIEAGRILMKIGAVKSVFNKQFGIDSVKFTGSGTVFSGEGWGSNTQTSAREYLTRNLRDDNKAVWTYVLDAHKTSIRDAYLKNILLGTKALYGRNFHEIREGVESGLYTPNELPVVIRFQQLDPEKYSGRLGKGDASRVFSLNLSDVYNMKLSDALKVSGFSWDGKNAIRNSAKIYIWLYKPQHQDDVTPATWMNIIQKAPIWLESDGI